MPALHDLRCQECQSLALDCETSGACYEPCPLCGGARRPDFSRWRTVKTDIWGQSRFVKGLDQTFDNVSDQRAYCRREGIEPAGDRVGGARTPFFERRIYSGRLFESPPRKAGAADAGR